MLKQGKRPLAHEECVFNEYFIRKDDSTILKILINLFQAVYEIWPKEWENPDISILTKTTGFTGIMKALPMLIKKGKLKTDLSVKYFKNIFLLVRNELDAKGVKLDSNNFPPSSASENKFKDIIIDVIENIK
jgi:hypothetical protein